MVQSGAKWCKMEHNFRKATLWLKKRRKLLKLTKASELSEPAVLFNTYGTVSTVPFPLRLLVSFSP
jgi:hypothetical protein